MSATENGTDRLPTAPATLAADQYLQFLSLLERGGLPSDVRAYLVNVDNGKRHVKPVPHDCAVLNFEESLIEHLSSRPISDELLLNLRDFSARRLEERGVTTAPMASRIPDDEFDLACEATAEIEVITEKLQREMGANWDDLPHEFRLRVFRPASQRLRYRPSPPTTASIEVPNLADVQA